MIENEEKQFIKVVFLFFFSTCVNYRKNRLQSSVVYAFELLMEFNATKSKHFIELFEILYSYCLNRFTTYYTQYLVAHTYQPYTYQAITYSHIPTQATPPICTHCNAVLEIVQHFVLDCPQKHRVWSLIVQRHNSDWTSEELFHFIATLQPPQQLHAPLLYTILSLTIHTIWFHHWKYIFDRALFCTGIIANIIDNKIRFFQRRIMVHEEVLVVESH
ncbi:hypothetical protein BDC45DRAFT_537694 [Circinella umbellata]|nr:hypothetical protein BDC45DRAFT_537694 [Circinella umbellata]